MGSPSIRLSLSVSVSLNLLSSVPGRTKLSFIFLLFSDAAVVVPHSLSLSLLLLLRVSCQAPDKLFSLEFEYLSLLGTQDSATLEEQSKNDTPRV